MVMVMANARQSHRKHVATLHLINHSSKIRVVANQNSARAHTQIVTHDTRPVPCTVGRVTRKSVDRSTSYTTTSTGPDPHRPRFPSLDQEPILDPNALDDIARRLRLGIYVQRSARPTIPLVPISLIIDLDDALSSSSADPTGVEHHARDGAVVGKGIEDGAGAEVPDLESPNGQRYCSQ